MLSLPILPRYFTEAVLDIYNCQSTSLTNSSFLDNTGSGISNSSYRGNTGAVSIGFNNVPDHISFPNVQISGCNFTNNSATARSVFRTSSQAFSSQIFSGRGGALGVFINESLYNISVGSCTKKRKVTFFMNINEQTVSRNLNEYVHAHWN